MGRSGYSEDWDGGDHPPELFYQAIRRSIEGKRGQKFLRELAVAMDAMPEKRLISGRLVTPEGECCAMGVVCKVRGIDAVDVDETDSEAVAKLVGIAPAMAAEIAYMNDDDFQNESNNPDESPEERWVRMRKWVDEKLLK